MELKYEFGIDGSGNASSNRTFMELKFINLIELSKE